MLQCYGNKVYHKLHLQQINSDYPHQIAFSGSHLALKALDEIVSLIQQNLTIDLTTLNTIFVQVW